MAPPLPPGEGPAFLFVVDTCISPQDFGALKKAISHTVSLLPTNAVVGLLSFGTQVHVHDLGSTNHYMKALVFDWQREYTTVRVWSLRLFILSLTFLHCNVIITLVWKVIKYSLITPLLAVVPLDSIPG